MIKQKTLSKAIIIIILLLITTYLLVSAPPPLPDIDESNGNRININELLNIVALENNVVRTLYTKSIVGDSKKQRIPFDENWKEKDLHAGPLPALFLRETAAKLKDNHTQLNLFLGSDFPIAEVNRLNGIQKKYFELIKKTGKAQFFYDDELKMYTAMFADYATDIACINCHNQHKKSPKQDWKRGDIMGATTWSYPKDSVTVEEVMKIIKAFRKSTAQVYTLFLQEAASLQQSPAIGKQWPSEGYFLPTPEVFEDSVTSQTSRQILQTLLHLQRL